MSLNHCGLFIIGLSAFQGYVQAGDHPDTETESVYVWSQPRDVNAKNALSPTSIITQQDIQAINVSTVEDVVKFEPSLIVRRRFIGDANGTLGIRGANMFQTSRSMVFADGVPLHYFLESRWNGAPRWSMVSASEVAQVEVVYGPFSAEYSGNAMGGVVLIETALPQKRELHLDTSYFNQSFDAYGFDDDVDGFKGFISYGDKWNDLSFFLSYNRLENTSHPQSFRDLSVDTGNRDVNRTDSIGGGLFGKDARSRERFWYGDTGVSETETDNFKFKLGYEADNWQSLINIAYESRQSHRQGRSYIRDLNGVTLWSANDALLEGYPFSWNSGRLNENLGERDSLSVGLRIKGELSERARLEANFNRFDILKDRERESLLNPSDPRYTSAGEIQEYDNSGWRTAELKLILDDVLTQDLQWISGARHETYRLNLNVLDSPDYLNRIKGNYTSRFGGETAISALVYPS